MVEIQWSEEGPTVEEYVALRQAAGLSPKSRAAASRGLRGSLYALVGRTPEGQALAMGRVIGDRGAFFEIVDMAVRPEVQGQGLGTAVMTRLMDYIAREAPPTAAVMLLADVPADRLYAKFGFRPTAPASLGMIYVVGRQAE